MAFYNANQPPLDFGYKPTSANYKPPKEEKKKEDKEDKDLVRRTDSGRYDGSDFFSDNAGGFSDVSGDIGL